MRLSPMRQPAAGALILVNLDFIDFNCIGGIRQCGLLSLRIERAFAPNRLREISQADGVVRAGKKRLIGRWRRGVQAGPKIRDQ